MWDKIKSKLSLNISMILNAILFLALLICGILLWFQSISSKTNQVEEPKIETHVETHVNIADLEKVDELVLLNAGIQKVKTIENNTKFLGTNFVIPGSEKKALIILNYTAKFGIKEDVSIEESSEHKYAVKLPKYEVIGVELDSEKPYTLYDMSGGILSASTQDIDTGKAVAEGFSNEEQKSYMKGHEDMMKEAAKDYYTDLIKSVDKEATVTVERQDD